ncbi:MAG: PhoX family protein [Acetobacteraceae bacterium]
MPDDLRNLAQEDISGDEPMSNHSPNPHFSELLDAALSRRTALLGSLGAAVTAMFVRPGDAEAARVAGEGPSAPGAIGFRPVPVGTGDGIVVPEGYTARVIIPTGTPISGPMPAFRLENTAADQAHQIGAHHDGMHFFPIEGRDPYAGSSEDGLLVLNHEYIEPRFLHAAATGLRIGAGRMPVPEGGRDPDQIRKEINAHGVSIVRIRKQANGEWQVVQDVRNRRITAATPMEISGPVRGSDFVRTKYSPDGTRVRGTINNCAHGVTPWNTYLTCEENWAGYFVNRTQVDQKPEVPREHARYGVPTGQARYNWDQARGGGDEFERFDATTKGASPVEDYRNEPNAFGWVVEIDPFNPNSTPVKRTHLGRFAHESVEFAPVREGRPIVAYSGDDAVNEYIYKFVSARPYHAATANGSLLDEGTLYVAKFNADGTGEWLPLKHGEGPLVGRNGFRSQAEVLVNTRAAADAVGATKMDRPEWIAADPRDGRIYCTLTNNTRRTAEQTDPANPRARNQFGHIIRWREAGDDHTATRFTWDIFVLAGPANDSRKLGGQALGADNIFACPDGLWFDKDGRLWIQTDIGEAQQNRGPHEAFGNNQMLCANPVTGEIRRFLTGPVGQEITGCITTPDGRTMFINVQHPGATTTPEDFAAGNINSRWPDGGNSIPRSATVVITKNDGGVIGT